MWINIHQLDKLHKDDTLINIAILIRIDKIKENYIRLVFPNGICDIDMFYSSKEERDIKFKYIERLLVKGDSRS